MTSKIISGLRPLAVPIHEVRLLDGNPRKGDVAAVARSLDKFSQVKPIVVRADTKEVVAGNHTLQAALYLGWDEIAVIWVEYDEATSKAFALADNHVAELGGYDDDALAAMIADVLEASDELLAATSYSIEDLEELLADTSAPTELEETNEPDVEARPDEIPRIQAPQPPQMRSGLSLFDRFMVPPFSVLSARDGWWQDRKRAWIQMGIEGELGREDKPRTWFIAAPGKHANETPLVSFDAAEKRQKDEE